MTIPDARNQRSPSPEASPSESSGRALIEALYMELHSLARRRMAEERPGHTLSPTALVHEAYARLAAERSTAWQSRSQFFAAAAEAMRRILIEGARARLRLCRGGDRQRVELEAPLVAIEEDPTRTIAVDEALERLGQRHPRAARVVTLRLYGGLTDQEIAETLSISQRSVRRDVEFARAALLADLGEFGGESPPP